MTLTTTAPVLMVDRCPDGWEPGEQPGEFLATGIGTAKTIRASVRVFSPESANPDYLLDRIHAYRAGPLGRPRIQSLPESLAEGVSVVAIEEGRAGSLRSRIDLVRRAYEMDIVMTAQTVDFETVEELFPALLELLAAVVPIGDHL